MNTIKVTMNDPDPEPRVEEQWLAVDVLGNLRLLKDVEDGEVEFVANATTTPPILLPVYPQVGYTGLTPYNEAVYAVFSDNATLYGESGFLLVAQAEAESDTGEFGANLNYFRNGYGFIAERSMWTEVFSETAVQGYISKELVTSTYQVYGSHGEPNSSQCYHPEQQDGFELLGSSSSNATFTGSHNYYIIHAPEGSFIDVDCVRGSNNNYYGVLRNGYVVDNTWQNMHTSGEPDGQTVQLGTPSYIIINASGHGLSSITVRVLPPNLD
ncbi:MAG: hypothetical protein HC901_01300 [Bdellovibrionaceae bacterium]|nr:hypothetical protein [Pseudobdellovibrionaceae bacterium]